MPSPTTLHFFSLASCQEGGAHGGPHYSPFITGGVRRRRRTPRELQDGAREGQVWGGTLCCPGSGWNVTQSTFSSSSFWGGGTLLFWSPVAILQLPGATWRLATLCQLDRSQTPLASTWPESGVLRHTLGPAVSPGSLLAPSGPPLWALTSTEGCWLHGPHQDKEGGRPTWRTVARCETHHTNLSTTLSPEESNLKQARHFCFLCGQRGSDSGRGRGRGGGSRRPLARGLD